MPNMLQKRFSKLLQPLKRRHSSSHHTTVCSISCDAKYSTPTILSEIRACAKDKHVTHFVLEEMIQRHDNVRIFRVLEDLLRGVWNTDGLLNDGNDLESSNHSRTSCASASSSTNNKKGTQLYFAKVKSIVLVEAKVRGADYRRWVYKKANFLQRIREEAKVRKIRVVIQGTLLLCDTVAENLNTGELDDSAIPPQQSTSFQTVSSWLGLLSRIPSDPDITSIRISLQEPANTRQQSPSQQQQQHKCVRKSTQLDLQQSPLQQISQGLVELFNSDTRKWNLIHCHVLFSPRTQDQRYSSLSLHPQHEEQTRSLLEVAELYQIPLQIQWQSIATPRLPSTTTTRATSACASTTSCRLDTRPSAPLRSSSCTLPPRITIQQQPPALVVHKESLLFGDDHTSITAGSSGAFMIH